MNTNRMKPLIAMVTQLMVLLYPFPELMAYHSSIRDSCLMTHLLTMQRIPHFASFPFSLIQFLIHICTSHDKGFVQVVHISVLFLHGYLCL